MPRNVRNFWIEVEVDGRTTPISTGPRSKKGGFSLTVLQRSSGNIIEPLRVDGYTSDNGELILNIYNPRTGELIHQVKTER